MNKFDDGHTDIPFPGTGQSSLGECFVLVSSLQKSLEYLAALRQASVDIDEDDREHMELYVERTAKNIYTTLTGKRP